ncbi:hypothetical protein BH686_08735 [Rhodococcus erythropolis]|nr:hypothetical protein BH686_08735 [Rhodococcus erythropolis]
MIYPAVATGKHQRLVPVVVPDQIGRPSVLPVNFEDLGSYLRLPNHASLDMETVTHFGMHHSSSLPARAGADQPLTLFPRYRLGNPGRVAVVRNRIFTEGDSEG